MDTNYRLSNPLLHYGLLALIYGVGLLTLFSHTLFHPGHHHEHNEHISNSSLAAVASTCPAKPAHSYEIAITTKGFEPNQINARRCDELIITNHKSFSAEPAFGAHTHHEAYPGFEETALSPHQNEAIRLYQAGQYNLHDHDNEGLRATVNVKS